MFTNFFSHGFTSLAQSATTAATAVAESAAGDGSNLLWVAYAGFIALVILFLALDLGVFHREAHEVSMKESIGWSIVWLTIGLSFSVFVYFAYDHQWLGLGANTPMKNPDGDAVLAGAPLIINGVVDGWTAMQLYLTGYVIEKSLAMDNIFVIAMIFGYFAIPGKYQHRVLFWGIIGALVMRGVMIGLGSQLIENYQWILIVFGLFLLATALKMMLIKSESDPSKNPIVRLVKKMYPVTPGFYGQKFFVTVPADEMRERAGIDHSNPAQAALDKTIQHDSKMVRAITPLFLALIMVEITDLVFAVDSIPAIFAITPDPFIVFTSNIFAILGLRALYFCLAALIAQFRFLKPALIIILAFVGVKLLLFSVPPYLDVIGLAAQKPIKIEPFVSLAVVVGFLAAGVIASVLFPAKDQDSTHLPPGPPSDGSHGQKAVNA
jgi:tellurite resistance protein TerC